MSRRAIFAFALLFAVSAGFLFWWSQPTTVRTASEADSAVAIEPASAPAGRTVAQAWQWREFSDADRRVAKRAAKGLEVSPISVAGVHNALRKVELDPNGLPVVDGRALDTLRSSMAGLNHPLTEGQLEELARIIRAGLPGPGGEQVAKIVTDFHRYNLAEREYDARNPPAQDLDAMERRQNDLLAMRQQHFGYDVAEKLFAQEAAFTRFTLESMRIQEAPGLSAEDKEQQQAQLRAQIAPGVLPDKPDARQLQWQERYERFAQEKQLILDAGLPERDQKEQIERLLATHFSENEREQARNYIPGDES